MQLLLWIAEYLLIIASCVGAARMWAAGDATKAGMSAGAALGLVAILAGR